MVLIKGRATIEKGNTSVIFSGFWNADKYFVFTAKIKTRDSMCFMQLFWDGSYKGSYPIPIKIMNDGKFHTYRIDLRASKEWKNLVSKIQIYFIDCEKVDFENVIIGSPARFFDTLSVAWESFLIPVPMFMWSINFIYSPYLFGKPFILLINYLVILFCFIAWGYAFLYNVNKKERSVKKVVTSGLFIGLLFTWLVYDFRNTYNEFHIMKTTLKDFVMAKEEDKRFYDLEDFYKFVGFLRGSLPADIRAFNFYPPLEWPYRVQARYLLYPISPRYRGNEAPIYVVYKDPSIYSKDGKLYVEDHLLAEGNVFKVYDRSSFIFQANSTTIH